MNRKKKKIKLPLYGTVLAIGLAFGMSGMVAAEEKAVDSVDAPVTEVEVTDKKEGGAESGYRNETVGVGPLGQQSLQDTPYSINVTSGELIENRGAHTMADALQTNPTLAVNQHQRSWAFTPGVAIRGFTLASNEPSYLRDGLPIYVSVPPSVEDVERIEVLSGTSGFLYGFGNVGGTINFVSKQPTAQEMATLTVGQYGGGINYIHADLGGPIDDDGRVTYRLNAYRENGDTHLDGGTQERTLITGAVNYQLSSDTLLKADFYHQESYGTGAQATFMVSPSSGITVPSAKDFDASTQYGQSWTYNESERDMVGIGLEKKLNETFTLRTAYRYSESSREWSGIMNTLTNTAGDYTSKYVDLAPQDFEVKTGYAFADANFDTGKVHHDLTFGYSKTDYVQMFSTSPRLEVALPGVFNIGSPGYIPMPTATAPNTNPLHTNNIYQSLMIGDQMKFNDNWSMLVGVNNAQLDVNVKNQDTGVVSSDYSQSKTTPSVAVLYKPTDKVTTYVSYMEGLTPGGTAPSTAANPLEMLSPSASEQYEAGVKTTVGSVDLAAAVFKINKINEYIDPLDNFYKQDGRQLHEGLEITATGKLSDNLTLVGGVTLLDPEVTQSNNAALEGKAPANVPEKQIRTYLEYDVPGVSGLTVTAGGSYYGARPIDAMNTADMPSATVYDAGLRYVTLIRGNKTTFNLNVTNLFDKAYWATYTANGGYVLGDPRMVALSAKVEF